MTKFDIAFDYVIENEGAEFVDDPTDRGGATKFGISETFVDSLNGDEELPWEWKCGIMEEGRIVWDKVKSVDVTSYIKSMTIIQAKLIYQKYFWIPIYEQIEDQDICNYIFDMTVQHGKKKAAELVQRGIKAYLGKVSSFKIDGIFGDETLSFINDSCFYHCDGVNIAKITLIVARESLFRCIVAHDKSQERFLEGWLKRCYR